MLFQILVLSTTAIVGFVAAAEPLCNGSPELCDRVYTNISFIGTHNSAFAGIHPSDNQNVDIVGQLDAGIRFLQAQVHLSAKDDPDSRLDMCHASCFLRDSGSLTEYLATIKTWLDTHPREVVTLLLVNGDGTPAEGYAHSFRDSGLQRYAFLPSADPLPLDQWPTLSEMIEKNTRLVVYLDNEADLSVAPFILNQFTYFFETPFAITNVNDFNQCNISRPRGINGKDRMMLMNHFLGIDLFGIRVPDRLAAPKTNAASGEGSLGDQATLCKEIHGHFPQVGMVDWFDQGDVFTVQRLMNGL
ncbi:PLC-like phosphodiesterase [Elsinoe ampelina]|uniref:PLC-like phosphodiesterase n=1 Tax=Elsinoe ampelina TaxID=302913 RepID=A0A6A6G9A0_9PEZI|nr:PLC-like phosphodiesterase [Elsinoe ampelina]